MTKNAEASLLAFLTSKENLPFVVEILQKGKQVRRLLLSEYWKALHHYVQVNMPKLPGLPATMEWLPPEEDELDAKHTSLWFWNSSLKQQPQYLSYAIYHERSGNMLYQYVCLMWEDDVPASSALHELKTVADLGKHLVSEDFKKGNMWFRYKEVSHYASVEDFMASIITCEKDSILRQMSESFWSLVEDTSEMVVKANEEICRACRK
jgi:hypothetical protein